MGMCGSSCCDNYSTGDQWYTVSVFIGRKMNVLHLTKENRTVNITAVKELLAMGLPTGLQFSITAIGSMVMQWQITDWEVCVFPDLPRA